MTTKRTYTLDDLKTCAGPCGMLTMPKKMGREAAEALAPDVPIRSRHTSTKCRPCASIVSEAEEQARVDRNRRGVEAWLASRSGARQRAHAARPARWRISA